MCGGFMIAYFLLNLTPQQYWTTVWTALAWNDVIQGGVVKPLVFAIVIALMGCFYGLRATGGTQGVGRSTTQAMVAASMTIFVLDALITKIVLFFVSQNST
jgi:phospholipid/cholesterol/gamma-HCH transport system permease protein